MLFRCGTPALLGAWSERKADKCTVVYAPAKSNEKHKPAKSKTTAVMKFGSWNIRTMTPGLTSDLMMVTDMRKTAMIKNKLERLQLDVVALQETRLAESGTLGERSYTFFWQGKSEKEMREHGVGFAIRNELLDAVEI